MGRTSRRSARGRRWWALAALLLVAAAWSPLRHAGTALVVSREVGTPDAIIMLASHEWERLPAAAAEARRYPRTTVLLTVPQRITPYNCHRCGERVEWLRSEGVASSRVVVLPALVTNTHSEAVAARAYAATANVRRLLIVTSPYHTRRALATFTTVFGGDGVRIGIAPVPRAQANPPRWWSTPYDRYYVVYEWAAIVKYRLVYGVPIR